MFGSHLSIAGSMVNALIEGQRLGMDCVQVFTKNQQQWKAKPLDAAMVKEWKAKVAELGWDKGGPTDAKGQRHGGITSHASYLINLAAPDDALWRKSIDLMVDELERCETLGIPFLIHHPGAFTTSTREQGLARIASAYKEIFARTPGFATVSCLEGTVGAGSQLGGTFAELAELRKLIIEQTGQPARVGYCLDTCHMHAAGDDFSTRALAAAALARFDAACGLANLKALHVNDSKGKAGSHLDRHDHIGEGAVGGGTPGNCASPERLADSGFAEIVNNPALQDVPKILETPKDERPGVAWDTVNLNRLKGLREGATPWVKPSSGPARAVSAGKVSTKIPAKRARAAAKKPKMQESRAADRKSRKPSKRTGTKARRPAARRRSTRRS